MTLEFHANARPSLTFSLTRDVMRSKPPLFRPNTSSSPKTSRMRQVPPARLSPRAALSPYQGPYETIHVLTDFQDQSSNARVYQRFQKIQQFVSAQQPEPPSRSPSALSRLFSVLGLKTQRTAPLDSALDAPSSALAWDDSPAWQNAKKQPAGLLDHTDISDIPLRNIDAAAQALFELAQEPNRDIFVHVTDPGVGSGQEAHKRSMLVTENHGVHIGPNNGTLGLLSQYLEEKQEPYRLLEIDIRKTDRIEALRQAQLREKTNKAGAKNHGKPETPLATGATFHGRDVFAVAAGAIAGGIQPESLATRESIRQSLPPLRSAFAKLAHLPEHPGNETQVLANRDNTSGNLVLNIALSPAQFQKLLDQKSWFILHSEPRPYGPMIKIPMSRTFGDVKVGQPLLYLGSKSGPKPGTRFLEVAINCGDAAQALQLKPSEVASSLRLSRLLGSGPHRASAFFSTTPEPSH